ncbi:MAG: hypothetical protein KC445_08695 [Anaerolineales bacterium]|nr:hypothetical protein [Anaerolineales bacterium]
MPNLRLDFEKGILEIEGTEEFINHFYSDFRRLIDYSDTFEKANSQEDKNSNYSILQAPQNRIIQKLYELFAKFMGLYRKINSLGLNNDDLIKEKLLDEAIEAESQIEAIILEICCEYAHLSANNLESMLGNLRQSVQIWRESIEREETLPFYSSDEKNYRRFKESFVSIIVFLLHQERSTKPLESKLQESKTLLRGAFSNKHEDF